MNRIPFGIIGFIATACLAGGPAWGAPPASGDYSGTNSTFETTESWNQNSWIGDEGDNNIIAVQTENGTLDITGRLILGDAGGSNNTLNVHDGGTVTISGNAIVGGNNTTHGANATHNSLTVSGEPSTFSVGSYIMVGDHGSNNTMDVTDGAEATISGNFHIGHKGGSENNVVTIDNSTLTASGTLLNVGNDGGNNTMTVTNSTLASSRFYIGNGSDSSGNTMMVSNSTWTVSGNLVQVGRSGANNSLSITDGSNVVMDHATLSVDFAIGRNSGSDNNTLTVSGSDTKLMVEGWIHAGGVGDNNILTVEDGAEVETTFTVNVGRFSGNNSQAYVRTGGWLNVGTSLTLGRAGDNSTVEVTEGGIVTAQGVTFSENATEGHTLTISGTNSTLTVLSTSETNNGDIVIGEASGIRNNTMNVLDNATVTAGGRIDVGHAGSNNTLVVNNGTVHIGTDGDIDIEDRGLRIGATGSAGENTMTVTGEDALVRVTGATVIGGTTGTGNELNVGDLGLLATSSTLEVLAGGSLSLAGNALIHVGDDHDTVTNPGTANLLRVAANGTLTANSGIDLGTGGTLLVQEGGTVQGAATITGDADVYGALSPGNSTGTLEFTGGLTLRDTSHVYIQLGDGEEDLIKAESILVEGGTLYFLLVAEYDPEPGMYTIFETDAVGDTLVGAFDTYNIDGLPSGWTVNTDDLYTLGQITIIPEPHTMGLILLGLGAVALRRRFAGK